MSSRDTEPVDETDAFDAAEQEAPVGREPEATERRDLPWEASEADAAEQAAEVPFEEEDDYPS